MFWLIRWLWRRVADYFTAIDILDWMEWKTWIFSIGGAAMSGVIAALLHATWLQVFGLAIAGACLGLGLLLGWQNWTHGKLAPQPSGELHIEFEEGDKFLHQGRKEGHGIREGEWWTYRFLVKSTRTLNNVQAYASTVRNEFNHHPPQLSGTPHPRLFFDDGSLSITLTPGPGRLVELFAHFRAFWNSNILIGGQRGIELVGGIYDVEVSITANELQQPVTKRFRIGTSKEPGGFATLIMTPLQ